MAEMAKTGSSHTSASVTPPSEDYSYDQPNLDQLPTTSESSNTSSDGSQQHEEAMKAMNNLIHPKMFTVTLMGGEVILKKLQAFAEKMQFQSGMVTCFVGDVEDIQVYFESKKKIKSFKGPRMVIAGSGNVSKYGGRLMISMANTKGKVTSGELIFAKVALGGSVEIGMLEVAQVQMHRKRVPGGVPQLELSNPAIVWMPLFKEEQVKALEEHRMKEGVQQKPVPVPENISIWPNVGKYDPNKGKDVIFYNNSPSEANSESDEESGGEEEGPMSLEDMENAGEGVHVALGFVGSSRAASTENPLATASSPSGPDSGPSLGLGTINFKSMGLDNSDSTANFSSPDAPVDIRVSASPPDPIGLC